VPLMQDREGRKVCPSCSAVYSDTMDIDNRGETNSSHSPLSQTHPSSLNENDADPFAAEPRPASSCADGRQREGSLGTPETPTHAFSQPQQSAGGGARMRGMAGVDSGGESGSQPDDGQQDAEVEETPNHIRSNIPEVLPFQHPLPGRNSCDPSPPPPLAGGASLSSDDADNDGGSPTSLPTPQPANPPNAHANMPPDHHYSNSNLSNSDLFAHPHLPHSSLREEPVGRERERERGARSNQMMAIMADAATTEDGNTASNASSQVIPLRLALSRPGQSTFLPSADAERVAADPSVSARNEHAHNGAHHHHHYHHHQRERIEPAASDGEGPEGGGGGEDPRRRSDLNSRFEATMRYSEEILLNRMFKYSQSLCQEPQSGNEPLDVAREAELLGLLQKSAEVLTSLRNIPRRLEAQR